jgi:peroxiredoxin Q/BCP
MTTFAKGDKAPFFSGKNQRDEEVSLSGFAGKKLILYFYPKDNTPGCTAEACNLNDNYQFWLNRGYEIVGVSPDTTASHRKFADKFGLKFNLVADPEHKILNAYGVWGEKKLYGKPYMGVLRTTFVINEKGIIDEVFHSVDTKSHSKQIAETILT